MARHPNIPKPLGFRSPFNPKTPASASPDTEQRRRDVEALDRMRANLPKKPPGVKR